MNNNIDSFYDDATHVRQNQTFAISNTLLPFMMSGLTSLELKLILREISTINTKTAEIVPHKWSVEETIEDLGLSKNSKNIYKHISECIEGLGHKSVSVLRSNAETLVIPWLARGQYNSKVGGRFGLALNMSLKPFLINLEKDFTVFDTEIIKKFSTTRALGMYMYMYSFFKKYHCKTKAESMGVHVAYDLKYWRIMLGVDENYRARNIGRNILTPIKQEIEARTDFVFDFEPIKEGRKITGYKIFFSPSKNIRKYLADFAIRPFGYEHLSAEEKACLTAYAKDFKVNLKEFCRVRNMLLDYEIWGAEKLMAASNQTLKNIEANIVYCLLHYKDKLEKMKLAGVICKAVYQNYVGNDIKKQKEILQIGRY